MNIKDKILSDIKKNTKKLVDIFDRKGEYFKIFNLMNSTSKNTANFKDYSAGMFENFEYDIYSEKHNHDRFILDVNNITNNLPENCNVIFCVNGCFSKKYTKVISNNLNAISTADVLDKNHSKIDKKFEKNYEDAKNQLSILNNLVDDDGIFINISSDSIIEEPIYILNVITELDKSYFINTHKVIEVGRNSSANISEINLVYSNFDTICSELLSFKLEENANVKYSKMYLSNKSTNSKISYIESCGYEIGKNASLDMNTINLGTSFNKNDTFAILNGINSNINYSFFSNTNEDKVVDLKTTIYHNAPNTFSNQLIKVVANDTSKVYFDGKIIIENTADNSIATQNSKAMLIADNAKVQLQPQLEIYNDNVKAAHGSGIGNLDNDILFYLKSRGIDGDMAKKILLIAFATDVINQSEIFGYYKDLAVSEIIENVKL